MPLTQGLLAHQDDEVREEHRRDGFEVGNADAIFASTTLAATTKQAA